MSIPLIKAHLKNRHYLIAYIRNKWAEQPVFVQLSREFRGDSIFYSNLSNVYDISILAQSTSLTATRPMYDYVENITMSKTTYKQMMDRLNSGTEEVGVYLTVQQFLDGIVTRADVIDEILAEL